MSTFPAPAKTPLGQEELRRRTLGLGQRLRTVLFLVDGRRPLGDILAMAHQAGSETCHFEELLRLGLVVLPEPVAAPPEVADTAPGALDIPKLTSVVLDVHLEELAAERDSDPLPGVAAESPPAPAPEPDRRPAAKARRAAETPPLASWAPTLQPAWPQIPRDEQPPLALAPAPPPAAAPRKRRKAAPPALVLRAPPPQEPTLTPATPPDRLKIRAQPADVPPPPTAGEEDTTQLQDVRSLLIHALGSDAALFAPLVLARVRAATTSRQLIGLVWEIERHRSHIRRARPQLSSLERARDILGMGNTLVAGDSRIDNDWPDTSPGYGRSRR